MTQLRHTLQGMTTMETNYTSDQALDQLKVTLGGERQEERASSFWYRDFAFSD